MATKDFKLPDLGEGVHEGQIVRVHVKVGDQVREDQPLMEVETDKASVEITCPFVGDVEKVHVQAGQLVHVGDVMVTINEGTRSGTAPAKSSGGGGRAGGGTGGATSVGLPHHATAARVMKSDPAAVARTATTSAKT